MSEISIQGLLTVRDSPHAAESCLLHARASHSDCADACLVRCLSHVLPQCWSRCLGSKPLPCSRRGCLRKGKGAQAVIQAAPISRSWSHDGAEADCGDLPGSSEGTSGISAMRCHLATWITRRNVEHGIISLEPDDSISAVEAVHFIYKVSCHLLGIPSS